MTAPHPTTELERAVLRHELYQMTSDLATIDFGSIMAIEAMFQFILARDAERRLHAPVEASSNEAGLCSDCPRVGHSTDITRCAPCPRRPAPTEADRLAAYMEG